MRLLKNILVTGGCGFIGSNFIRFLIEDSDFNGRVVNLDKLTYAGNPENLQSLTDKFDESRYILIKGDIGDRDLVLKIMMDYDIDTLVHFAAESHVDRAIDGPQDFIRTNLVGTFTLLETARHYWSGRSEVRFHHVSTDEVFGSLGADGYFFEHTAYAPRNPYSASKAGSDHLVRSYFHTYNLPVTVSNCSNNYGPFQFPEKMIPLMILNIRDEKPLPVYGDGANIRDWLYVTDHCTAIWRIVQNGAVGETYNIGGENEYRNIDLVNLLCEKMAVILDKPPDYFKRLITFVKDRPGHDLRYAINCDKIKSELGWRQSLDVEQGLERTIRWYLDHPEWIAHVRSGEYQAWIKKNYEKR